MESASPGSPTPGSGYLQSSGAGDGWEKGNNIIYISRVFLAFPTPITCNSEFKPTGSRPGTSWQARKVTERVALAVGETQNLLSLFPRPLSIWLTTQEAVVGHIVCTSEGYLCIL